MRGDGTRLAHAPGRLCFTTPRALTAALRAGEEVRDQDFDRLAAGSARIPGTSAEATPLAVGARALQMLTDGEPLRVLDAGAGTGKLCIVGALTTPALFTGIERQLPLVRAARAAALRFGALRTTFLHGSVEYLELDVFDAIYLFDTPSGHNPPRDEDSCSCMALTWRHLARARPRTRVVRYRGELDPPGCALVRREDTGMGELALFVKR